MKCVTCILLLLLLLSCLWARSQSAPDNPVWTDQSKNASESMPCGGHDIGLNVWVENGDLLFYMQQSGAFDEYNTFLKAGRIRIQLHPNPFGGEGFYQELQTENGSVRIQGENDGLRADIAIWVDVFHPVIHVETESNRAVEIKASYESWRYEDRDLQKGESFQNSFKWAPPPGLQMKKDRIAFEGPAVVFYHRNEGETIFDATVAQQKLDSVKDQLFNPLENLSSGGCMYGEGFIPNGNTNGTYCNTNYKGWQLTSDKPRRKHEIRVALHTAQTATFEEWTSGLNKLVAQTRRTAKEDKKASRQWWTDFWNRSFIHIETPNNDTTKTEQLARNCRLFRYMLGCNAFGDYPTKFNGGLFTVDPVFTHPDRPFTPDFRNWGGGTFTAQNQRLVYWPLLKSGDFDLVKPQLDFYVLLLNNAEWRSRIYWNHPGACFTEQIENFGLPNPSEYGWKRPDNYDAGMEYNAWLEYQWDTALEFCAMALHLYEYTTIDITGYIPLIESCLTFFDEHYQYLAKNRGSKTFDANGHLVIYPGSACETYKMSTNAISTLSALKEVTRGLLRMPDPYLKPSQRDHWKAFLKRLPPLPLREIDGHRTLAPAALWERVNNTEVPQLYPVFPWGIFGVGKPGLDLALNTWVYDPDALKFRGVEGWKQDAIWAARLGLTGEAASLIQQKLGDAPTRFPAFWGPGFDWTPDHNHGGSGMIALQEMLLQTSGDSILLFPAWPNEWDVHFRLHAPQNTLVEAKLEMGKLVLLNVNPKNGRRM